MAPSLVADTSRVFEGAMFRQLMAAPLPKWRKSSLGFGTVGAGIAPMLAYAAEVEAVLQASPDSGVAMPGDEMQTVAEALRAGAPPDLAGSTEDYWQELPASQAISYEVPLDEVQGNVTPGFRKDHQAFLFLRFPGDASSAGPGVATGATSVHVWLDQLRSSVSSARTVAEANQRYREARAQARAVGAVPDGAVTKDARDTFVNVAFTAAGLGYLLGGPPSVSNAVSGTPNDRLKGFLAGMCNRNGWTGDDLDDIAAFTVRDSLRSDLGGRGVSEDAQRAQLSHALIIIGADRKVDLESEVGRQIHLAQSYQMVVLERATIWGQTLGKGREHFGFTDSRSQPDPDDPLTGWIADGKQIVAPGEFISGLDSEPRDGQTPDAADVPDWELHGSYLVIRKLRQDVTGFWRQMEDLSAILQREVTGGADTAGEVAGSPARTAPGEPSLGALFVAAKLLGRWPGGAAVTEPIIPGQPFPADPSPDGSLYKSATPERRANFAQDPHGAGCPLFAHVRKANPRVTSLTVKEVDLRIHRIIRRGIPYVEGDEKGLVFIAYQARISDGYEHIQREWLNDGYFGTPESTPDVKEDGIPVLTPGKRSDPPPPGPDPLSVVRNRGGNLQVYLSHMNGQPTQRYVPRPFSRVVTARGGGYFFAPSISALELLASGSLLPG